MVDKNHFRFDNRTCSIATSTPHGGSMTKQNNSGKKSWRDSNGVRYLMLTLGWILLVGAIAIGPLPGPGPVILAPIGLALILKNSLWAKRHYARLTKRHPTYGQWMHWLMRRSKAKEQPPLPPIKADIMHMFRRDDIGQDMP